MSARAVAVVVVAAVLLASGGVAKAAPPDPVDRTITQVRSGFAGACRRAEAPPEVCNDLDGRAIHPGDLAAYKASWVHRAHGLQRELDDHVPLLQAFVPHTHNSFNSAAYAPTLSGSDHNQLYAIGDQLDMDMRAIELDVHWFPSAEGPGFAPILCHGQAPSGSPTSIGCTTERHLKHGLQELKDWLDDQTTPELVLLYLENNLTGVTPDQFEVAHNAAADTIREVLHDDVIKTPAAAPCAEMPLDSTRAELRGRGRVLIVGDCGPGRWGEWVHLRGPRWNESSSDWGDDYLTNEPCPKAENQWVRHWEDQTWLSAVTGGGGEVTRAETRAMTRCGVNMPGFDNLTPRDERLAELIWSWAPNQPVAAGDCAAQGAGDRFHAESCDAKHAFACLDSAGQWRVTTQRQRWDKGFNACVEEYPGSRYAVPANGYANELLAQAKGAAAAVWVNYTDAAVEGDWVPNGLRPRRKR